MEKRTYQEYQEQPQNQSQDQEMKEVQRAQAQPEGHETPEPSEDRKPQEQQEQPTPKTELWAEGFENLRDISWNAPIGKSFIVIGLLLTYYWRLHRPQISFQEMYEYVFLLILIIVYVSARFDPENKEVFKNIYTKIILLVIIFGPLAGIYFWRFLLSN